MDITIVDRCNRIYVKSNPFILEKRLVWGKYISFFAVKEKVFIESLTGAAYPVLWSRGQQGQKADRKSVV